MFLIQTLFGLYLLYFMDLVNYLTQLMEMQPAISINVQDLVQPLIWFVIVPAIH